MQARRRRRNDQVVLAQIGGREHAARKLECRTREPSEFVLAQRLLPHVLSNARLGHDRDVELLSVEHPADDAGIPDGHRSADRRIALLEATQKLRQAYQREALVDAEPQHALERVARTEALDHLAGGAEHAIGVFHERVAFGGKADAWAATQE